MLVTSPSVIVLTQDEEANIAACLESVSGWAKEIFIVDSGSTDGTLALAAHYTKKIFHHPFENYAAQRNWAQTHLPLESEWVFHLDADERVSADLARQVTALFVSGLDQGPTAGVLVRRRIEFLGRHMRFGGLYPTYHCRIFRKKSGRCESREYDQHFIVDGPTIKIDADLIEVTASSLDSWTQRHRRWAQMEARQLSRGPQTNSNEIVRGALLGSPIERRRWWRTAVYERSPLFARAFAYFFLRYFLRAGILDGIPGLIYHVLHGFWFRFYVDACLYERRIMANGTKEKNVAGAR
jgi:glycosyltransferase involved in cell wall biosynthesis